MNTRQAIQPSTTPNVFSISYSASGKRFVTGLSDGFRSFRTDNCLVTHEVNSRTDRATAIVEALDDRYYAFVSKKRSQNAGASIVIFYDAVLDREVTSFDVHEPILGLRLTSEWMAVVLEERTILFQYQVLQPERGTPLLGDDSGSDQTEMAREAELRAPNIAHSIYPTSANTYALAALSDDLLVLPAPSTGQVQLITLNTKTARTKRVLKAHNSSLRCIALSSDASLLATTSEQGTLIRVWSTKTTDQLAEFRRGMDHSVIYSLSFSPGNKFVASTSDKGTLHVFDLRPKDPAETATLAREKDAEHRKHRKAPSYAQHRLSGGTGFDHDSLSGMSAGLASPAPSTAIGGGPGTAYHGSVQEYYGLRAPPAAASPPARDAAASAMAALKASPFMPRAVRDVRSVASAPFYTGTDPPHWQGGPAYSWTMAPNGTKKRVKNPVLPLPNDPSGRPPKGLLVFQPASKESNEDDGVSIYVVGGGSDARWEKFDLFPVAPSEANPGGGWGLVNRGFRNYLSRQFVEGLFRPFMLFLFQGITSFSGAYFDITLSTLLHILHFGPSAQRSKMQFTYFAALTATLACTVSATLDPATSNSKGQCPTKLNCSATKKSTAIQAAECSHNTRTHEKQTFAVFTIDHQYDDNHGAPYGDCSAYTCEPPATGQMKQDADCWTFFWEEGYGAGDGEGAGCIKDPNTGECGCEDSDGTFTRGKDDCT
ncbi:SVP1-like protein 2 [Cercospora zeina]